MRHIVFTIILFISSTLHAQQFITSGKIEFEKRTNQHSLMDDESMWDEMFKNSYPKFVNQYYDLLFDEKRSLYKTGRDPETRMIHWAISYINNTVYKNLEGSSFTAQKEIFGSDFLVTDSIKNIEWKITNEPRTIAGFECRKAVGRIFDSIVVVAFYTEEIVPSSGPELFGGLPGMILGLAIPRMHTTWYATKLELKTFSDKEIAPPNEGKKINEAQFETQMKDIIKEHDWLKKLSWQMLL